MDHLPSNHDAMEFRHIVERLFINCLTKDATSRQFYFMYYDYPNFSARK